MIWASRKVLFAFSVLFLSAIFYSDIFAAGEYCDDTPLTPPCPPGTQCSNMHDCGAGIYCGTCLTVQVGDCGGTRGSCSGSCDAGYSCEAPFNPQNGDACACRGGSCGRSGSQCVAPFVARPDPQGDVTCKSECVCPYPNEIGGGCVTGGGSHALECLPRLCCNPNLAPGAIGACPDYNGHCVRPTSGDPSTHFNCYQSRLGWTGTHDWGWDWWCLKNGNTGGGNPGDEYCTQSRCPAGMAVGFIADVKYGAPGADSGVCDNPCGGEPSYAFDIGGEGTKWGDRCYCRYQYCCDPNLPVGAPGACPDDKGHCVNPYTGGNATHYNCYQSQAGWTAESNTGWNWWCLARGHTGGGQPGDVLCSENRCGAGYNMIFGNTWVSGAPGGDPPMCNNNGRCGYNPPLNVSYEWDNGDSKWGLRCSCQAVTCQLANTPPTFTSLVVTNDVGTSLTTSNNRNHICQQTVSQSASPRRMRFVITGSDGQGGADITGMTLTWNGHNLPVTLQAPVGNSRSGIATVDFPGTWNNTGTFPLNIVINDSYNETVSDSSRSLKVWDCNVQVSGNMYDSSDAAFGAVCATGTGFNTLAPLSMNFTSVNVGSTAWAASGGNTYAGGNLSFSYPYTLNLNADVMGSGVIVRWVDSNVGTINCGSAQTLNSGVVDPFAVSPRLKVDFSAIRNQEPWFQIKGGGVQAGVSVANMVPITCANNPASCTAATTLESSAGAGDNGWVTAATITNNSGCGANCVWGTPNNWTRNYSTLSATERYGYTYFYDRYFSALGLGVTLPNAATMSQVISLGGTGVYLVNGDFNVDTDNALIDNRFLMIIAKGTITFLNNVNSSAGIFIGDAAVGTSTGANTALSINGVVYSPNGNVRLNRGFTTKTNNNTRPAVVVNYRPDLVFNMPGLLFRILSNWKQF